MLRWMSKLFRLKPDQ
nr:unnamed protein product [Callosobruchus analis]